MTRPGALLALFAATALLAAACTSSGTGTSGGPASADRLRIAVPRDVSPLNIVDGSRNHKAARPGTHRVPCPDGVRRLDRRAQLGTPRRRRRDVVRIDRPCASAAPTKTKTTDASRLA